MHPKLTSGLLTVQAGIMATSDQDLGDYSNLRVHCRLCPFWGEPLWPYSRGPNLRARLRLCLTPSWAVRALMVIKIITPGG